MKRASAPPQRPACGSQASYANRNSRTLRFFFMATLLIPAVALQLEAQESKHSFAGRWDLTLSKDGKSLPSWIEVSQDSETVKVVLVGTAQHATLLKEAAVKNGELIFVSPKDDEGFSSNTTFQAWLVAGKLVGSAINADGKWRLTGQRAPALRRRTVRRWGRPVRLFNGKDFTGWRFSDPSKAGVWKVEDGTLVHAGHGADLISIPVFEDFKLHLEFNCGPQSNSGIYLRGRYEVQIETDSAAEPPSHHTGGVYGFLDPVPEQPRRTGLWQSFDIDFVGRTITVIQNGITVIDHKEVPGITGGALDSHEDLPGPIYLQGSEEGQVTYRNIVVTPAIE